MRPREALEDGADRPLRNTDAVVPHHNPAATAVGRSAQLDIPFRFRLVGILDGVGEQVYERELQPADVNRDLWCRLGNPDIDAAQVGHVPQLTRGFPRDGAKRHRLRHHAVASALVQPGHGFKLPRQVDEVRDIAFDDVERALGAIADAGLLKHADAELYGAKWLAPLVR